MQNQSQREMDDDSSAYKQMNRYPLNLYHAGNFVAGLCVNIYKKLKR